MAALDAARVRGAAADAALAALAASEAQLPRVKVFATAGLLLQHMDECCPEVRDEDTRTGCYTRTWVWHEDWL